MSTAPVLRVVAVAIAVTALADPVISRERAVARPLAIVLIEPASAESTALTAAERLRASLSNEYSVSVRSHSRSANTSACPADGGCIAISSGTIPRRLTAGAEVIGAVRVPDSTDRSVTITQVDTPSSVSVNGAGSLDVHLRAAEPRDAVRLQVFDGDVLVGSKEATVEGGALAPPGGATIVVPSDRLIVPVEWVPLAAGARRLRVTATTAGGEGAASEVDVGVEVISDPAPVLMYEAEATWLGTFVRRAVAGDARFRLDARTRLGPGLTAARGTGAGLTTPALTDTRAVIVSAPESLTVAEVDLLGRFVRVRGGSVVLLPDRPPTGPMTRLLPPVVSERRETAARQVGLLRASELVTFDGSLDGVTVLESVDSRPVVVSRAVGRGRVVVSGALDAWRFREGTGRFNQFFSGLLAAAVDAAGRSLQVTLDERIIRSGERTNVTIEWRTMEEIPTVVAAAAELRCDDGHTTPVRLWPGARRGMFTGKVQVRSPAACRVDASITQPSQLAGSAALLVVENPRRPLGDPAALDGAIAAHGGVIADVGNEAALAERVRERLPAQRASRDTWPMRSPWWMLPLAACLGGEWWLRRRKGEK